MWRVRFGNTFSDRLCGDMFLFAGVGGGGCVTFSFFCAAPSYAHFGVTLGQPSIFVNFWQSVVKFRKLLAVSREILSLPPNLN